MSLAFEWDEAKAEANLDKHGVDFVDAVQIFAGTMVQAPDERRDYGESRIRAIGEHDGEIYVAIYTVRRGMVRIISAWKAGRNDRRKYHQAIA